VSDMISSLFILRLRWKEGKGKKEDGGKFLSDSMKEKRGEGRARSHSLHTEGKEKIRGEKVGSAPLRSCKKERGERIRDARSLGDPRLFFTVEKE